MYPARGEVERSVARLKGGTAPFTFRRGVSATLPVPVTLLLPVFSGTLIGAGKMPDMFRGVPALYQAGKILFPPERQVNTVDTLQPSARQRLLPYAAFSVSGEGVSSVSPS